MKGVRDDTFPCQHNIVANNLVHDNPNAFWYKE